MIALNSDCLFFEMANGERIACSAEMVGVELAGETGSLLDPDLVGQATKAVFHYFKHELGQHTVSAGEFAGALEKILRGFAVTTQPLPPPTPATRVIELDLCRLAHESGPGRELFFFARLRDELRRQLRQPSRVLRFHGLRSCVKQLAGTRRWSPRCRNLESEIVAFLRECLGAEPGPVDCTLWVE